jgi:hypothetical protein
MPLDYLTRLRKFVIINSGMFLKTYLMFKNVPELTCKIEHIKEYLIPIKIRFSEFQKSAYFTRELSKHIPANIYSLNKISLMQ